MAQLALRLRVAAVPEAVVPVVAVPVVDPLGGMTSVTECPKKMTASAATVTKVEAAEILSVMPPPEGAPANVVQVVIVVHVLHAVAIIAQQKRGMLR